VTVSEDSLRRCDQRANRKRGASARPHTQTSNPQDLEKGRQFERHGNDAEQVRFTAVCPKCESEAAQGPHGKETLRELHRHNMLRFYCDSCDHQWEPTIGEKENVMRLTY
jgi:phage terminase large subunit GpA-like protein